MFLLLLVSPLVAVLPQHLLPSNYCYYQEYHQPDVCQHYLAIRKRLTCDGAERHVVVVPPFQKSLFHDYFVFS